MPPGIAITTGAPAAARSVASSCARYFVSSYVERKPDERSRIVRLVDDRAVGVPEDVHGRDVEDPRHGGADGGVDQTLGAGDVRLAHRRRLGRRDSNLVHGGCVDDEIASGPSDSVGIPPRSPTTSSQPRSASASARPGDRTSATTSSPRWRKRPARRPPRNPVRPVTKTLIRGNLPGAVRRDFPRLEHSRGVATFVKGRSGALLAS